MWNVIDREQLTMQLAQHIPYIPGVRNGMSYWARAGSTLKACYRWHKDKLSHCRKDSAEYKRHLTIMDKLQQEIKRG